jgi:hypothetical protein
VSGSPRPAAIAGAHAVVVVEPPLRTATVYRSMRDVRILAVGKVLDLADIVPGWAPAVGDVFA